METGKGSQTGGGVDERAMFDLLWAFISPLPGEYSDSTVIQLISSCWLANFGAS